MSASCAGCGASEVRHAARTAEGQGTGSQRGMGQSDVTHVNDAASNSVGLWDWLVWIQVQIARRFAVFYYRLGPTTMTDMMNDVVG